MLNKQGVNVNKLLEYPDIKMRFYVNNLKLNPKKQLDFP